MKKQKTSNTKKLLIIGLALLLVASGSFVFLKRRSDARKRAQATETQPQETIKYAPATDEEKQAAEDNKKNLPDNTTTTTPPPSGLKQVSVTITSIDTNPVRARVDGVVEDTDSGCTATFTKGSETFSVSAASVANVSNTMCAIRPGKTLSPGQWQITVSFKSNSAEGTSAAQTINI